MPRIEFRKFVAGLHDIEVSHGNILGRSVGLDLTLDDFQKVSDEVPFLVDLKPSGKYVMEDVHKVGLSKNILSCAFNSLLLLKMAEETSFLVFKTCSHYCSCWC